MVLRCARLARESSAITVLMCEKSPVFSTQQDFFRSGNLFVRGSVLITL